MLYFVLPTADVVESCCCDFLASTVSCLLIAPVSLTGCADSDLLDLDEALLGGAVRGLDGLPKEADLDGEMR